MTTTANAQQEQTQQQQQEEVVLGSDGQPLTHPELVKSLAKPGYKILSDLNASTAHLLHMAACIPGEVAELVEVFVKGPRIVYMETMEQYRTDTLEEFGDIEFYMQGIRQEINVPFAPVDFSQFDDGDTRRIVGDPLPHLVIAAGTIFDVIKKHAIYAKPCNFPELCNVMNRFDGIMALLYARTDILREEALQGNIKKLSARYKTLTYSNEAAQERADKVEK